MLEDLVQIDEGVGACVGFFPVLCPVIYRLREHLVSFNRVFILPCVCKVCTLRLWPLCCVLEGCW